MQLLDTFITPDYINLKADLDTLGEDRANPRLGLMQLWRDAYDPLVAVALFDVRDRSRAQEWLGVQQAVGRSVTAQFVRSGMMRLEVRTSLTRAGASA